MKILIFNWRDIKNPSAGGAEAFTHENARRWINADHEVTLFTSKFQDCKKEETVNGIKIVRAGSKYSVYREARKYYKKYFKGKFDVIIDEINTRPFSTPKFVENEKIIVFIHQLAREYWFYEVPFPINYIGYHFLEGKWLSNYRDIPTITISNSTKQDLLNLGFKKVFVISAGITFDSLTKVSSKEKEPTLIYIGRLKKAKRPDHAIKAFNLVKRKIPNAKLWIVGDGYLRKDLEKKACNGVKFFAYMPEKEKIELLSRAWVLINPSIREGWGINIIEANACSTPCIAYDVPGLRDSIKNNETGLLARVATVEKLAEEILKVLSDHELRQKLSENALKWAKNFSWDKSATESLRILEKVLEEEDK